jgi:hypothetical protein
MKSLLQLAVLLSAFTMAHFLSACTKHNFVTSGATIGFSSDTLTFDTVFTSVGSVTKEILIYNRNNKWLKLKNIQLAKGSATQYRLNIDGASGNQASNLEIAPFDSLYVFVAVTVDPSAADLPFIIEDDLVVSYNDRNDSVHLMTYGQNAIFINDSVLQGNLTWTNQKPYVIVNSTLVDSTATLTIQAGARIYMHANSKFFVKGTLIAQGTKADSIIFQGDRLDREYFGGDASGEWCGLHFLEKSHDNVLAHCTIKNGGAPWKIYDDVNRQFIFIAPGLIYLEPDLGGSVAPKLSINSCYIGMSISYGVLAFNSTLRATNSIFYTCGANNFAAVQGGNYNLSHCTFANYGYYLGGLPIVKHDDESILALTNNLRDGDGAILATAPLNATLINCIVQGNQRDGHEVLLNKAVSELHNVNFQHCILTTTDTIDTLGQCSMDPYTVSLIKADAQFENANKLDFKIKAGSAAKLAGLPIGILTDIEELARNAATPSVGAHE